MKELRTFSPQELQTLKETLEKASGLILPNDPTRFGELKFHVYSGATEHEFHFQIFWGPHKIFTKKHLLQSSKHDLLQALQALLKESAAEITQALLNYCAERLNDFLQIELQPLLMAHGLDTLQVNVKVKPSTKAPTQQNGGWPIWCLLMSWVDEFGEFQEFAHKIFFDVSQKQFQISAEEIVKNFVKYRNQLW